MRPTSSRSSVQPGTITKRTQTGRRRAAKAAGERVHGRVVLAGQPPVQVGRDRLEAEHDEVEVARSSSVSRSPRKPLVSSVVWTPSFCTAAHSLSTKRCCINGSPPLIVSPPFMVLQAVSVLADHLHARVKVTGIPLVIFQVSGLWQ